MRSNVHVEVHENLTPLLHIRVVDSKKLGGYRDQSRKNNTYVLPPIVGTQIMNGGKSNNKPVTRVAAH